jgi:hypothetical protein
MLRQSAYHRVFRLSAWYDLAIALPFTTIWTFVPMWRGVLSPLVDAAGFGPLPMPGVYGVLFANFFGCVVTIWAILRLVRDDVRLARWDGAGRVGFSIAMINAMAAGASPLLWVFLVPEIAFGVAQLAPPRRPASPTPPGRYG